MNEHVQVDGSTGLIRAGRNEPRFNERYRISLQLPLAEQQFVDLVRSIPLPIERFGTAGLRNPALTRPLHYREFDMSNISHGYLIDGGYNSHLRRNELYRAYVNDEGYVVYVENAFSYQN